MMGEVFTETRASGAAAITLEDWGWLVFVYVVAAVVRGLMLVVFYPALKVLGYSTTVKDCVVMWWGGLRGAVGMALAVMVKNSDGIEFKTGHLFIFLVGGVAMLTLLINATTCGKLVKALGLTEPGAAKESLMKHFRTKMHRSVCEKLQTFHASARYQVVDLATVKSLVSCLNHHEFGALEKADTDLLALEKARFVDIEEEDACVVVDSDALGLDTLGVKLTPLLPDARCTFYAMLKAEYWEMINEEVLPHDSVAATILLESLDAAVNAKNRVIHDFEVVMKFVLCGHKSHSRAMASLRRGCRNIVDGIGFGSRLLPVRRGFAKFDLYNMICCMDAHREAQQRMADLHIEREDPLLRAHEAVISESAEQVACIEEFLVENKIRVRGDPHDLETKCRTKQLAIALLVHQEKLVDSWVCLGLLTPGDKEELLEEHAHDLRMIKVERPGWQVEPGSDATLKIDTFEGLRKKVSESEPETFMS
eukprot:NODE_130_length_2002_cov_178.843349.p1 GENE.NODE_130_length_2002_cov_178.843349~~NODE_130_length_2002_cov_178.843349.p1  ORF type:complete len:560 (-),score=192.05 NODE_130_length_2002_cov_178.843349:306-1742(-)